MKSDSKLFIIGIGPGNLEDISRKAFKILQQVEVIIGYQTYMELIEDLITEVQETFVSGMRQERERAEKALQRAQSGKSTAVISSGDAGVYGMAGLILELKKGDDKYKKVETEVIPGITAANAAAALLGAPLMHDYTVISLSDILTPWKQIEDRLKKAAAADFITALYNPQSSRRTEQIKRARDIYLNYHSPTTPVGIVRRAGRSGEEKIITNLENMLTAKIDMLTTVIIGNSNTYIDDDKMITPRGYKI